MIIEAAKLLQEMTIEIAGQESWLQPIYDQYTTPKNAQQPTLTGKTTLTPSEFGFIEVSGKISYAPIVNCHRCNRLFPWPINQAFKILFEKPTPTKAHKEYNLSQKELDQYFIGPEGTINLEEIINEQIILSTPTTLRCHNCTPLPKDDKVYEEKANTSNSPFAVLSELKSNLKKH